MIRYTTEYNRPYVRFCIVVSETKRFYTVLDYLKILVEYMTIMFNLKYFNLLFTSISMFINHLWFFSKITPTPMFTKNF
jgi:hypothetical protein